MPTCVFKCFVESGQSVQYMQAYVMPHYKGHDSLICKGLLDVDMGNIALPWLYICCGQGIEKEFLIP